MGRRSDARDRLLNAGLDLFRRAGYAATGITAIVDAAGVPKGSFYHFFPGGKEAFARDVVRHDEALAELSDAAVAEATNARTPLARLRSHFARRAAEQRDLHFPGTLLGTLTAEVGHDRARLGPHLSEAYDRWSMAIAVEVRAAQLLGEIHGGPTYARRLAAALIAGWEGAVLQAHLRRSAAPLDDFIALWFDDLQPRPKS